MIVLAYQWRDVKFKIPIYFVFFFFIISSMLWRSMSTEIQSRPWVNSNLGNTRPRRWDESVVCYSISLASMLEIRKTLSHEILTAGSPPHGRGAGVDNAYVTGTAAVLHTHCHCTGPRMAPDCALPDPAAASCALRHSHPLHSIPLSSLHTHHML